MPYDKIPKYEAAIDGLLFHYGLEGHAHDSLNSKMARLIIALHDRVTNLEFHPRTK